MSAARDRLLKAAAALFGERGYECVGINEIIAKADVAKATFYQHFPSKEQLCAAWLRDEAERSVCIQQKLLEDPRPVKERLYPLLGKSRGSYRAFDALRRGLFRVRHMDAAIDLTGAERGFLVLSGDKGLEVRVARGVPRRPAT